ncbi:MAG: thermonuclease family protein [Oligoflexus sp.]
MFHRQTTVAYFMIASISAIMTTPGFAKDSTESEALAAQTTGRIPAEITHCNDGDTCRAKIAGNLWMNVRLAGIDAPELAKKRKKTSAQAFAEEARDWLNNSVKQQPVELLQHDLDHFNRPIVELYVGQRLINIEMLRHGLAEVYQGKTKRLDRTPYLAAEAAAKEKKIGIWSQKNYQSPKDFRRAGAAQK